MCVCSIYVCFGEIIPHAKHWTVPGYSTILLDICIQLMILNLMKFCLKCELNKSIQRALKKFQDFAGATGVNSLLFFFLVERIF